MDFMEGYFQANVIALPIWMEGLEEYHRLELGLYILHQVSDNPRDLSNYNKAELKTSQRQFGLEQVTDFLWEQKYSFSF